MRKEILENIYKSKRNCIISGDMSVGKTSNLGFGIVKKIVNAGESLFILDSREEYLNKFYDLFKENNYNIKIINIKDPLKSEGWNLFDYSYYLYKNGDKDGAIKYLEIIADEIFSDNDHKEVDSFWLNSAGDLFKGIVLSLFADANSDEINLRSVSAIIDDINDDVDYVAEYFRTKEKNDISYVYASGTVFSPIETRGGIVTTAKGKLSPIVSRENLNKLFNKTTFVYEDFLDKPSVIFFVNSENDSKFNFLSSIFIREFYNILLDNNKGTKFNFVLDNFDTITNVIGFKDILSSCIYNNMKFYILTRDKMNLEKRYSNYINKLTNDVVVKESEIVLEINGEKKSIVNQVIKNNFPDLSIDFPVILKKEIKVFNLKKYLLENLRIDSDK